MASGLLLQGFAHIVRLMSLFVSISRLCAAALPLGLLLALLRPARS